MRIASNPAFRPVQLTPVPLRMSGMFDGGPQPQGDDEAESGGKKKKKPPTAMDRFLMGWVRLASALMLVSGSMLLYTRYQHSREQFVLPPKIHAPESENIQQIPVVPPEPAKSANPDENETPEKPPETRVPIETEAS